MENIQVPLQYFPLTTLEPLQCLQIAPLGLFIQLNFLSLVSAVVCRLFCRGRVVVEPTAFNGGINRFPVAKSTMA